MPAECLRELELEGSSLDRLGDVQGGTDSGNDLVVVQCQVGTVESSSLGNQCIKSD